MAAVVLLAAPEGSARPPHRVVLISDFRDAGTMQLNIKGPSRARGMQEERRIPGPTGAVGVCGGLSLSAPSWASGASGHFGASLADESGAQLQLSGQGTVLRFIPSGYSKESFCFQLFQLECSLGKHLWVLGHIQPRHEQHSSWTSCCPALQPGCVLSIPPALPQRASAGSKRIKTRGVLLSALLLAPVGRLVMASPGHHLPSAEE